MDLETARGRLLAQAEWHQSIYQKYADAPNGPDHISKGGWTDTAAAEYHRQRASDLREVLMPQGPGGQ